jgi:hypothetical protein
MKKGAPPPSPGPTALVQQPGQALAKNKRAGSSAPMITYDDRLLSDAVGAKRSTKLDEREQRDAELTVPGYIESMLARRQPEELSKALEALQGGAAHLVSVERSRLLRELLRSVVEEKGLLAGIAATNPGLAVSYLVAADQARFDLSRVLAELSGSARPVTVNLLSSRHCRKKRDDTPPSSNEATPPRTADSIGATLHDYMWRKDVLSLDEDWNNKATGIAAPVYNHLWNGGDYDKICELILMGVSTARAYILPMNSGRGSTTTEEGVWSGYIQPLEHLLSTYLKRVDDLGRDVLGANENRAKVEGARKVLAVLSARKPPTGILTSYREVQESGLLKAFQVQPGTFWGFEDVRLPYVEAARATSQGIRPLRMMDLWAAVQDIIMLDNYRALLQKPAETIALCVEKGVKTANDAFDALEAGKPNPSLAVNYAPMLKYRDAYIKAFREQAMAFLDYLSKQGPEAKVLTAALTGKDAGKMMGALACKAGLWWARQRREPVYYCLDGIDLDEVVDYKTFKTKLINTGLQKRGDARQGHSFFEVITLAEMREILRKENWDLLKNTVKFVSRGKILEGSELDQIHKVRQRMAESDVQAPERATPARAAFDRYVTELGLDPELVNSLDTVTLKQVVTKATVLGGVDAEAEHVVLFLEYLWDCKVLYTSGVLPDVRMAFLDLAREMDTNARKAQAEAIVKALNEFPETSPYLRDMLTKTANRIAAANPIDPFALADELYPRD